jgi:acetyl-CoA C-acetyltransferase
MMGIGPVPAIQTLLGSTGLSLPQIDRFEINEAFGAQVLACQCELGLDRNKLNVNGGAICHRAFARRYWSPAGGDAGGES